MSARHPADDRGLVGRVPRPDRGAAARGALIWRMAYTSAEGRQRLLDEVGRPADELGLALACLGEAYELLDEASADRLEAELLSHRRSSPTAASSGRTATSPRRYGAPTREFAAGAPEPPSQGAKDVRSSGRSRRPARPPS